MVVKLYDYLATRLHCCIIGIGCMTLPIVAVGGGAGWVGWTVLT